MFQKSEAKRKRTLVSHDGGGSTAEFLSREAIFGITANQEAAYASETPEERAVVVPFSEERQTRFHRHQCHGLANHDLARLLLLIN
jgi:hypothetical protein